MGREADAVASFLTTHQPYADMPIMQPHTRIGPFCLAKELAIARADHVVGVFSEPIQQVKFFRSLFLK